MKRIFALVCLFLCSFFVAHVQAEAQGLYFYAAQASDPEPVAAGNTVRYYPDTDVFKLTGFDNEIYVVRNAKDLHVMCEAGWFEAKEGSLYFVINVFTQSDLKVNGIKVKVDWMRVHNADYYSADFNDVKALAGKYGISEYVKGGCPFN